MIRRTFLPVLQKYGGWERWARFPRFAQGNGLRTFAATLGMKFTIEYEREEDGRWIAEIIELPGVMAYGKSPDEAMARAKALALDVISERQDR